MRPRLILVETGFVIKLQTIIILIEKNRNLFLVANKDLCYAN